MTRVTPSSSGHDSRNCTKAVRAIIDRKSTRLNSSHVATSYAVFCLKKKDHYNLQVGAQTALMTREHLIKRFGIPENTVGMYASGGASQQYIDGQQHACPSAADLTDA